MLSRISRIEYPELLFGFVAPIGADLGPGIQYFKDFLERQKYHVVDLKVTDLYSRFEKAAPPAKPLATSPVYDRFNAYIDYGNYLREKFTDDAILAAATIDAVVRARNELPNSSPPFERTAYLIRQFKRREEVELLRSVYGRLFFQISAYSRRGARVEALARRIADSEKASHPEQFRNRSEELVQRDTNESDVKHGQRVSKIFHDADFIINLDVREPSVEAQVNRFCEIVFSSNACSPTHIEYGMFSAKAAALRTLDLSRQIGAAIFSPQGEIVAFGSNEVPKAGGGTYWSDEKYDARDYALGRDSNDQRKFQIVGELLEKLGLKDQKDQILANPKIQESQIMDALEYGRIVHAEMCAISDAARLGRATKDGILFTTTFPCHLCAKHIVAAGISKVWFLEPYPKSLAADLHPDSLDIENSDRGPYLEFPAVKFEHFFGITPRRYRELFERGKRKDENGFFVPYIGGKKIPYMDIKAPFYHELEREIVKKFDKLDTPAKSN